MQRGPSAEAFQRHDRLLPGATPQSNGAKQDADRAVYADAQGLCGQWCGRVVRQQDELRLLALHDGPAEVATAGLEGVRSVPGDLAPNGLRNEDMREVEQQVDRGELVEVDQRAGVADDSGMGRWERVGR